MQQYAIILEFDAEAKAYSVTVPDLPGCTSQGDTVEEAKANAKEAIEGHVIALRAIGEDVPEQTEHSQAIVIDVIV